MKAIVQDRYGSVDALRVAEVERPVARDGEVLVRVRAASVHPDVWHVVSGIPYVLRLMGAGLQKPKNPIPGTDMAGLVEALGPGVADFVVGDEVFGETLPKMQWQNGGTYAEYVTAPAANLAKKPPFVSFEQAATVPTSGMIALFNLRSAGLPKPGEAVLVNGAGGGVGTIAVQLAKAHGAVVTAVDRADKLAMLRSLGADRTIDYQAEDFRRGSEKYDLVFDVASNLRFGDCVRVLTPTGKYLVIGHDHYGARGHSILGSIPQLLFLVARTPFTTHLPRADFTMPAKRELMAALARLLEAGKLTPVVERSYALADAPKALRDLMEGRLVGRAVVTP